MSRPTRPTLVPAAARQTSLPEAEAVLNLEAIEVFAKALGGRDQLADALAVAGSGSDVEKITTLLLDPRYASWSLPRLCQMVGITIADLFAAYRKAAIARAHIEATHIIAARLPPIVTDVMDKALPHPIACDVCGGRGQTDQTPCWRCKATGSVLSEPTVERHKLALELGQLLEKKGGLIVQQNNVAAAASFGGGTGAGSLETLQQAVGDLLFGSRRQVVDIERETPPADLPPDEDEAPVEEEPWLPFDNGNGGDAPVDPNTPPPRPEHPPPLDHPDA